MKGIVKNYGMLLPAQAEGRAPLLLKMPLRLP